MSLMDMVRQAGNESVRSGREDEAASFEQLKRRVREILPSHVVARMGRDNPTRAENEVRRACQQVFEANPWLAADAAARERLMGSLIDSLFGLGPLEPYLEDETVTEIMVNGCSSLFVERSGTLEACGGPFSSDDEVRVLIDRILGPLGRRIDEASPMVNARLASGHRVHAVIPPIAIDGPTLTIRKFRTHVMTMADMQESGSLEPSVRRFLRTCVAQRKNIAVSGGTGSGKTTLLNALSCEISKGERIVTIEDSAELRFLEHPHVVRLEARPESIEGTGLVSIRDLVINALRMRPDRIIVGECRGGEALDMLQAMNTGHDGSLTTLHANSPVDCISRLTTMVRYAVELPVEVIESQIASAIDYIVQVARSADGRRFLCSVSRVGPKPSGTGCLVSPVYTRSSPDAHGVWVSQENAPAKRGRAA